MSEAIQADMDIETKMSMVSSELSNIASLSGSDMYRAMEKIREEPEKVEVEGEREGWVRGLLDETI